MNARQRSNGRSRRRAARIYALVLRLYPRAHRQAFADQMLQAFGDHYRDAVETACQHAVMFWLGVVADAGRSLAREHQAAVRERVVSMRKGVVMGWAVGLPTTAIVIGLALFLAHSPAGAAVQQPMPGDSVGRALLSLALFVLTLGLYAALAGAIVRFARSMLQSGHRPGWVRLGLVLGGTFGVYVVMANALATFLPSPDAAGNPNRFLLLTLPLLLAGVAGMIGGYRSGRIRMGVGAGLLTGVLGVLVDQASQVLMIVLVWLAIQHHVGPAGIAGEYQRFIQQAGHAPDLGTYVSFEYLQDGFGLPITFSLITLTLEGLCAALGGWVGASQRDLDRAEHPTAGSAVPPVPAGRPVRFLLGALALAPLVWIATVELNAVGGAHRLLGLGDVGNSLVNQAFGLWLLGLLVALAFVLVSARFTPVQAEATLASG
jgi:hypothetical protein